MWKDLLREIILSSSAFLTSTKVKMAGCSVSISIREARNGTSKCPQLYGYTRMPSL